MKLIAVPDEHLVQNTDGRLYVKTTGQDGKSALAGPYEAAGADQAAVSRSSLAVVLNYAGWLVQASTVEGHPPDTQLTGALQVLAEEMMR